MKKSITLIATVFVSLFSASNSLSANEETKAKQIVEPITIATWNAEHLSYPARKGCKPRRNSEIRKLRSYTESLNADVIAFQEVHSEEAVRQVLPGEEWQVIMSERPDTAPYQCRRSENRSTQQKVAFAVKKDIEIARIENLDALAIGNPGLRYGLAITIDTPMGKTDILNVHLKSGCFVDDYVNTDREACELFEKQAPILDSWIEGRANSGQPFVVLGDFNHRIGEKNNLFRQHILTNDVGSRVFASIITQNQTSCNPQYPIPIDHIIIGGDQKRNAKGAIKVHPFDGRMLSDHCAVSFAMR